MEDGNYLIQHSLFQREGHSLNTYWTVSIHSTDVIKWKAIWSIQDFFSTFKFSYSASRVSYNTRWEVHHTVINNALEVTVIEPWFKPRQSSSPVCTPPLTSPYQKTTLMSSSLQPGDRLSSTAFLFAELDTDVSEIMGCVVHVGLRLCLDPILTCLKWSKIY